MATVSSEQRVWRGGLGDATTGYEASLAVLRAWGYQIIDQDPYRFFFRVQAHLDANSAQYGWGYSVQRKDSYFTLQIYADGTIVANADGYHVKEGIIDERLARELDALLRGVHDYGMQLRAYRPVTPPSAPPSAPPSTPTAPPQVSQPAPGTSI
jgi:hypothetical protein